MHIALIIADLSGGGAERSVLTLAAGFIERGHRVDIVLLRKRIQYFDEIPEQARLFVAETGPDRNPPDAARMAQLDARMVRLRARPKPLHWLRISRALHWDPLCLSSPGLLRHVRAIASYIDLARPDCLLPNLSRPNTATLLARCLVADPPPVVPTVRNFAPYHRYRTRRRYRRLAGNAAYFVGVSRGVSASLSKAIGVPGARVTTIYNPVVTPRLRTRMAERPDHPWFSEGTAPVILAAGRLEAQKDHATLIKAFARVAAQRPHRLVILGEGKQRKRLEGLVQRLGLGDRVALPGWVDNPFAFMARASLFVLSSTQEGLPGVLVQALACGCPCVSTDCPAGPAEILEGGRFGPLVPVGDDAALAAAMERVLASPPDGRALQRRAADFSVDRAVDAYEKLMAAAAAGLPSAAALT